MSLLSVGLGGAIALGTVFIQQRSARRAEERARREDLTKHYLFQLQDAADSLWLRLENLERRAGASVMDTRDDAYREISTLYALGRYLAVRRMLTLDGVWPQLEVLDSTLARALRESGVESAMPSGLFHYDAIALGETVLDRADDRFRTSTYLEFRRRYESGEVGSAAWRQRVWETVRDAPTARLLKALGIETVALENATGIACAAGKAHRMEVIARNA